MLCILPKNKILLHFIMEEHYLTEDIVIKTNKTYYKDKLVKKHNWHLILGELGWEKLSKQWIKKLNKLNNPYPNNSLYGALECGDDGDCLFHCIAYSLNTVGDNMYDNQDIRNIVADSISQEQFKDIITIYRSMKDLDDFDEEWDPYEIDTLSKFKEELSKTGNSYWGDHLLLQLIMEKFNINVLILSQNEFLDIYDIYPTFSSYKKEQNTIILIHENEQHFKLLGRFNDVMITNFTHLTMPLEIKRLFNLQ